MLEKLITSILIERDKRDFGVKNKIFFFKELGYLLGGGVGIMEAIQLINKNTSNFALKDITHGIQSAMQEGKTLTYALNKQRYYFSNSDISIIKAGEQSGTMITTLKSLAKEYQFLNAMYNQYMGALLYPIILIVIAIGAVLSLFTFVLPGIFSISTQFEQINLPFTTQLLKSISEFLVQEWTLIGAVMTVLVFFLAIVLSTKTGQSIAFRGVLQVPVLGKISQYYYTIKMARYMKLMISSGMNYVQTCKLLQEIITIPLYQDMLHTLQKNLEKGESLYDTLQYEDELIPSSAAALIKVGEETAKMPTSLDNIIDIYEEDMQSSMKNLSKVIEPIMLVFIGGIIIVIALGVFGVITNIMDSIQI